MPVVRGKRANIDPEPPRNGGPDSLAVERLAFDIARLDHVLRQCAEQSFVLQFESKRLHPSNQTPLPMADCGQSIGCHLGRPAEPRPVLPFVDANHNRRSSCGDYGRHSPHGSSRNAARNAVIGSFVEKEKPVTSKRRLAGTVPRARRSLGNPSNVGDKCDEIRNQFIEVPSR